MRNGFLLRAVCSLSAAYVLAGCTAREGIDDLAIWTRALAETQSDGPELLLFKRNSQRLAFVAVEHDADPASATHRLITDTFERFAPKVAIVEGVPTSWGYDPAGLLPLAQESPGSEGLVPNGETVPTVRGALRFGSKLIGGEPDDRQVRNITSHLGVSDEDLLGFYVLRVVPQWMSQGQLDDLTSEKASVLIDKQLANSRAALGISATVIADANSWRGWRAGLNPRADVRQIAIEEAGPLTDGPWRTSRIGSAISRARDTHLYQLIREQLRANGSVMVVYGGSHAHIQYPALKSLLGEPCFKGANLDEARKPCLS